MDVKEYIAKETNVLGEWKNASEISTFKGGGKAFVIYPESVEKAIKTIGVLRSEKVDFSMLGKGSNTLVSDGECKQVLVSFKHINDVKIEGYFAVCEGGASVRKVVESGRKAGFGGLEFLSGVPCSVGGALKMNAGAFLSKIEDYMSKLYILNIDCANCDGICIEEKSAKDIDFGYRKGVGGIVLKAVLRLYPKTAEQSIAEVKLFLSQRRAKQPVLPSLGSVFKNGETASGKLIDLCGLKGLKIGGAQVSQKHANFIVNTGGATANDYLSLASFCKKAVFEKTGILLEEEYCVVR